MKNTQAVLHFKSQFVDYAMNCYKAGLLHDPIDFTDNYILDSLPVLKTLNVHEFKGRSIESIPEVGNEQVKSFLKDAIPYLFDEIKRITFKKAFQYDVPHVKETSIQSIFTGLKPEGNNDADYQDVPSDLALATFGSKNLRY